MILTRGLERERERREERRREEKRKREMESCALCEKKAALLCDSDQAKLCWNCDEKVHSANLLVARHLRVLLCRLCHSPTPWRASGGKLTATVSFCQTCVANRRARLHRLGEHQKEEENEALPASSSSATSPTELPLKQLRDNNSFSTDFDVRQKYLVSIVFLNTVTVSYVFGYRMGQRGLRRRCLGMMNEEVVKGCVHETPIHWPTSV